MPLNPESDLLLPDQKGPTCNSFPGLRRKDNQTYSPGEDSDAGVKGLGARVEGFRLWVQALKFQFGVKSLGFRGLGLRFGV